MMDKDEFMAGFSKTFDKFREDRLKPPTPEQLKQKERMEQDIKEYGDAQEFTYRKVRCYMKRNYGWCGYLDCGITADEFESLEDLSHGGMTAHNGFDCAHPGDYPLDPAGEYRDYAYVKHVLERMVDELIKN